MVLSDIDGVVTELGSKPLALSTLDLITDRFDGREMEFLAVAVGALAHRFSGTDLVVAHGVNPGRRWLMDARSLDRTPEVALSSGYTGQAATDVQVSLIRAEDGAVSIDVRFFGCVVTDDCLRVLCQQIDGFVRVAASCRESVLRELPAMSGQQLREVVAKWNDTGRAYPARSAPALFLMHARCLPDTAAIITEDGCLTYGQLCAEATGMAKALRARGVGGGDVVGLFAERVEKSIVAMVAIALGGAVCLPLDPDYPPARLNIMLDDPRVRCVLTPSDPPAVRSYLDVPTVAVGDLGYATSPLPDPNDPPEVATVLYTSGSTGVSKGVEVTHRGILRVVTDGEYVDLAPGDVMLHYAPATFDGSLLEIWGALARGATLAVAPPGPLALHELSDFVRQRGVTVAWLTAGLFHQLVEFVPECFGGLRRVIAGGDVLSVPHIRKVLQTCPGLEVVNGYGPTENTVFTCCHLMRSAEDLDSASVPIGRPLANTQVFVVDAYGQPVPPGVVGELWAAGDGLAAGYTRMPALSAQRFLTSASGPLGGTRVYRTGDRVRWRPDGVLEFVGRSDQQVKVNGFRVEPGEVEVAIGGIEGVEQVCVVLDTDATGGKRMSACVVGDERRIGGARGLRTSLRRVVPGFLVPSRFLFVDRFPLTPNGKVDRAQLLGRLRNEKPR